MLFTPHFPTPAATVDTPYVMDVWPPSILVSIGSTLTRQRMAERINMAVRNGSITIPGQMQQIGASCAVPDGDYHDVTIEYNSNTPPVAGEMSALPFTLYLGTQEYTVRMGCISYWYPSALGWVVPVCQKLLGI